MEPSSRRGEALPSEKSPILCRQVKRGGFPDVPGDSGGPSAGRTMDAFRSCGGGGWRTLGAEPVRASLFEPGAMRAAVDGADAIFHLATRIPAPADMGRRRAWSANDRIRRDGTRVLVDAALAAGVQVLVYPGIV